jgi:hypothetical protein
MRVAKLFYVHTVAPSELGCDLCLSLILYCTTYPPVYSVSPVPATDNIILNIIIYIFYYYYYVVVCNCSCMCMYSRAPRDRDVSEWELPETLTYFGLRTTLGPSHLRSRFMKKTAT